MSSHFSFWGWFSLLWLRCQWSISVCVGFLCFPLNQTSETCQLLHMSAQTSFRHVFMLCLSSESPLAGKCERIKMANLQQMLCSSLHFITLAPTLIRGLIFLLVMPGEIQQEASRTSSGGENQPSRYSQLMAWPLRFHRLSGALGNKIKPGSSEFHRVSGRLQSYTQASKVTSCCHDR